MAGCGLCTIGDLSGATVDAIQSKQYDWLVMFPFNNMSRRQEQKIYKSTI